MDSFLRIAVWMNRDKPSADYLFVDKPLDDARMRLLPGEVLEQRMVRFRTLGCYPLTGAIESEATTLQDIVSELIHAQTSERQGRAIDADAASSMETKKRDGYF